MYGDALTENLLKTCLWKKDLGLQGAIYTSRTYGETYILYMYWVYGLVNHFINWELRIGNDQTIGSRRINPGEVCLLILRLDNKNRETRSKNGNIRKSGKRKDLRGWRVESMQVFWGIEKETKHVSSKLLKTWASTFKLLTTRLSCFSATGLSKYKHIFIYIISSVLEGVAPYLCLITLMFFHILASSTFCRHPWQLIRCQVFTPRHFTRRSRIKMAAVPFYPIFQIVNQLS